MLNNSFKLPVAALVICSVTLSGCATIDGAPQLQTTERKIATCLMTAAAVGIITGIIVNQTDSKKGSAGRAAATGFLVAGAACAVWMAVNTENDKKRIAEIEAKSAEQGQPVTQTWRDSYNTNDGRKVPVTKTYQTTPSEARSEVVTLNNGTPAPRMCRYLNNTVSLKEDGMQYEPQTSQNFYCKSDSGMWVAATPPAPSNIAKT